MPTKIGLLVGREWSFPPAFIEEVNRRGEGVTAEYVKLGGPRAADPVDYAVILDRISHAVPFYRTFLRHAALHGVTVINNPFVWSVQDRFLAASLATSLDIAVPRTIVLPHHEYAEGIVHEESLRNLEYPLDWDGLVGYVGLPCVLRDGHGEEPSHTRVCHSVEELVRHYDASGRRLMIMQELIVAERFVRCLAVGRERVLAMKYDPAERRYHVDHQHLTPELGERVVEETLKLVRAVGYDLNVVEWAIRDGVPYAIDFMNPVPDLDIYSLTPHYFDWAVENAVDIAIQLAREPRPEVPPISWADRFGTGRGVAPSRERGGGRNVGDGAGELAEGLPSLARGLPDSEI